MDEPILRITDLCVTFGQKAALKGLSLTLKNGEILCMTGPSGGGKSVCAHAILGLTDAARAHISGDIIIAGRSIRAMDEKALRKLRANEIAYAFQDAQGALDPVQRIGKQLVSSFGTRRQAMLKRALRLLGEMGLNAPEAILRAYPHQLSGGERQRIVLCAALLGAPRLLIADEVTASLDMLTQQKVLRLLKGLCQREGLSLIVITHDLSVIGALTDRVCVLADGRLAQGAEAAAFLRASRRPLPRVTADPGTADIGGARHG